MAICSSYYVGEFLLVYHTDHHGQLPQDRLVLDHTVLDLVSLDFAYPQDHGLIIASFAA